MTTGVGLGISGVVDFIDGPVRVWERGPEEPTAAGGGDCETIVLVHGILTNADVWRNAAPELARTHRVVTLDLPMGGHDLPMRDGADFSLFGLASLVDRTVRALDLDRVTLVGNVTGGAVCQVVAARHPDRIARLVLTPCDAFDNFLPWWIRHLQLVGRTPAGLRALAFLLQFRWVLRLPVAFGRLTVRPIPRDVMASYVGPLWRCAGTRRDFARLITAVSTRYTWEAAAGLRGFGKPSLVLWGAVDKRFFPLAHAERLAGLIPAARLVVIPDGGALLPEDRPRELARQVADFVAETSRTSA